MHAWTSILVFLLCAGLSGFYGAAVAGFTTLARYLEERGRAGRPAGLAAFLLRDATAAVTAWVVGALWAGLGAALALGQTASRLGDGTLGAAELALVQLVGAGVLLLSLLLWKRLAEAAPRITCEVAALLALPFHLILYPVRRPLGAAMLRLYPPLTLRAGVLFADEVQEIATDEERRRLLQRDEREMITRVIHLGQTVVREIMVPRIDMVALEEATPIPAVVRIIQREGHSRLPVYRGSIDNIVGFLYSKDLIVRQDELDRLALRDLVRGTYFVPETKRVIDLLADMRQRRIYLAVVVDEYGGTAGMVTMEDVIEEVVGEIHDELDEEQPLVAPLGEGAWKVDAKVDLDHLNEALRVQLPAAEYDTLGGFLFALAGKIPASGDRYEHEGIEFVIAGVRGRRITQVEVRPHRPAAAAPEKGEA
jgi:CBS domain containing-hemolysin-like protein